MPISDECHRFDIAAIIVDRENRQRRKIETSDLEQSILKIGQIQPIIINRQFKLIAGERRLTALKNLGRSSVMCRFFDELTPIESQIVEMEENLKRQDLEWKDIIRTIGAIHQLYLAMDETWTATDTGEQLSLSQPTMSQYLRIWNAWDDPRVQDATSTMEAYNRLRRRDQRAAGDALEELLGATAEMITDEPEEEDKPKPSPDEFAFDPSRPTVVVEAPKPKSKVVEPEVILNQSFLEWAPLYKGPKFNLIHCDFPYGTNLFAGPQGKGAEPGELYDDNPDVYWELLDCLCEHLDNFTSLSAHLMFWYSMKHHERTMKTFADKASSWRFTTFPLIWFKTDNAGIASDSRFTPRHVYETCLVARRSDRQILKVKADCYASPTDKRLHVSTKPEPMLREFMQMFCDETTSLFDPTCGSGAALRAADSLGAKRVLGLEIDAKCCEVARTAFRTSRLLRGASDRVSENV